MHLFNRPVLHVASVVFVVFLIYSNTLNSPFQLDDTGSIVDNAAIRDLHNFIDTSRLEDVAIDELLRPLLKTRYIGYLSFALNYAFHGLDVRGYHLINILIHITNALLLYGMLQLIFLTPRFVGIQGALVSADSRSFVAVFTTFLFAVHPIQTQAVTYIVQRFASLATLFYLLSLVTYIRFRLESANKAAGSFRSSVFYVISLVSTILAMKTKEFALLIPVMIALFEFVFFDGRIKKRVLQLLPYVLTMSIIPLSLINMPASTVSGADGVISGPDYLLTQFRVIMTYLRLLIFPVNQNLDYDYPIYRSVFASNVLFSLLFLFLLLVLAIWLFWNSRRKEGKAGWRFLLVSFGLFWFFLTALPESGFMPIKDVIFEHRMYLPSIGLFLAGTVTIELIITRWLEKSVHTRKVAVSLMVLAVVVLSVMAYARNTIWEDSVRLSEDIVKKSPNKARPYYNLGLAYSGQGRIDEAIAAYTTVIRLDPAFSTDVYNNLGIAFMARGRVDDAIRVYTMAVNINPRDGDIHYNLAGAYMTQGRIDEAIAEYQASAQRTPDDARIHFYLGVAYANKGLYGQAINEYAMVLRLHPEDVVTRNNIGNAYIRQGRLEEALNELQTALRIKPDFAEAHYNLGNTYSSLGRREEANNEYREALRLRPDFIEARRKIAEK